MSYIVQRSHIFAVRITLSFVWIISAKYFPRLIPTDESGIVSKISVKSPFKVFAPSVSKSQPNIRFMSLMLAAPSIRNFPSS